MGVGLVTAPGIRWRWWIRAQVYHEDIKQDVSHNCSKIRVVDAEKAHLSKKNKNLVPQTHLQILSHWLPKKLLLTDQMVLIWKMRSPLTNTRQLGHERLSEGLTLRQSLVILEAIFWIPWYQAFCLGISLPPFAVLWPSCNPLLPTSITKGNHKIFSIK